MKHKSKTILNKTEQRVTRWEKLLDRRALTKWILIVGACACSPFARGQSGSPAQNPLGVESPQQMQAHISKLEAEVAELKAIVNRMQPGASAPEASTADAAPSTPVTAAAQTTACDPADSKTRNRSERLATRRQKGARFFSRDHH